LKKIAFISTNKSAWGGSEYLWYNSSFRFLKSGYEIIVSVPRWKEIPSAIEDLKKEGIKVNFNTDIPKYKKMINRLVPISLQFNYTNEGFKFLFEFKPDLVFINQGGNTGGIDLMEFCMSNNFKFVTLSNAANEAKWPSDDLNKRLSKCLPKAVINYYVSKSNLRLTELQIGQSINNSRIIVNPFNVEYDNNVEYPEIKENYFMAHVARLEYYAKGQDILFQVLNERKWRERNLVINLYGKGEHIYSVNKLKNYFKLDKVVMSGHISPTEIWKANHILILTSRYEGLPLSLIEAMLCKRTSVVTKVSGNPEVIIDNENGFLAKAATLEFVDEAMEKAWQRREEWKEMGIKANEYIKTLVPKDPVDSFIKDIESLKF